MSAPDQPLAAPDIDACATDLMDHYRFGWWWGFVCGALAAGYFGALAVWVWAIATAP